MNTLYLLDTNIIVHLARRDALGLEINRTYSLLTCNPRPVISVVTVGEMRSLAYQWQWGEPKKRQMRFLLGYFRVLPIDEDVLETYALMDSYSEQVGRSMGKNDAWIAATAFAYGAHLLTSDNDFSHLSPSFIAYDFIDPDQQP